MTDDSEHPADEAKRSTMKKGALAAGTAALGVAASAGTASAQDDEEVLLFADDYLAGQDFNVIAELEQSTTVSVLERDGETVSEISQPDEYDGYIIRYDTGNGAGITALLFSDEASLSSDDSGSLGEDATMFSSELNLLGTSLE